MPSNVIAYIRKCCNKGAYWTALSLFKLFLSTAVRYMPYRNYGLRRCIATHKWE